jgi:hypothetical protein
MTVVFPDTDLPGPTNGGFSNQEEFRKFVSEKQNGKWDSALHSRPTGERMADYKDDTIADAFPKLFPFGYTGLPEDPCVVKLKESNKQLLKRKRLDVLRKYLQHRNPYFHAPVFNLIVENLIMKESIFEKTRMFCSVKCSDNTAMGEKYGSMTADKLEKAIGDVRNKRSVQHSSSKEHQYLKSIRAACQSLPHSNEASLEARKIYFSYLSMFGLPAIFLTINPDDLRNFRIVVYALKGTEKASGSIDVNELTDDQILADFKVRKLARFNHPGLCAEEYQRTIDLVIKHLFNWNVETQKSNGVGLFGEVLAWCLATEEQGRKTLHGHFLLFIRDWRTILKTLQRGESTEDNEEISYKSALIKAKKFYKNACSAELFSDFAPHKPLADKAVFHHEGCRGKRKDDQMRYTVNAVSDQNLREMRHKRMCVGHQGKIASCGKCAKTFTMNEIVSNGLTTHVGKSTKQIPFPDGNVKRLDRVVYEQQKDFKWDEKDERSQAARYFASNALTNVHLTNHATRCFKNGKECFANLPDAVAPEMCVIYSAEFDVWADYIGNKENRHMFRLQPARPIDSVFMNTQNPTITSLLGINNNVMVGMNGKLVLYVTGYQVKCQQKEETAAYEAVSVVLLKILRKKVSKPYFSYHLEIRYIFQQGANLFLLLHFFIFDRN